jgi:hypothetical protein
MVVRHLDIERATVTPCEADPPMIVDPDTVLPSAATFELLKPISWRNGQVGKYRCAVDDQKLPRCRPDHGGRETARPKAVKYGLSLRVRKGLDHLGA